MSVAKRVSVFILVCFLSLSAVLTVNVEARERVFDWVIERFPRFSIFIPHSMDEVNDSIELTSLKVNYITTGFELVDNHEGRSYYGTENIEVKEITFKESQAYIWEADGIAYLIWYQDGVECHIVGNLSQDDILKIGESISK